MDKQVNTPKKRTEIMSLIEDSQSTNFLKGKSY